MADEFGEMAEPERTLLDTIMRYEGRGGSVATILLIVGICMSLISGSAAVSLLNEPWELDVNSPVVESVDSECRPFEGALFTVALDGRRYGCGGADAKCGELAPVPIAYDPEDPARCRLAANVDRLSDYELLWSMFLLSGLFACAAGGAYKLSERLNYARLLAEGPPQIDRRIAMLRRLSGLALLLGLGLGNGSAIVFVLSQI